MMKPEKIDVVYAICQCPLPKIKGVYDYKFKCDICGCEGTVGTYREEKP